MEMPPPLVFWYLQYGSEDDGVKSQLVKQLNQLNKGILWIILANLGSQMEPDEVNDTTKKQMIELIIPRLNAGVGGLVLAGGNPADQESESSEGKGKGKGNDVMDINAFLEHMGEFVQNLPQGKGKGSNEVRVLWHMLQDDEPEEYVYHLHDGATTFDVKKLLLGEEILQQGGHPMAMTLKTRFDEVLQNDFVINEDTTLVLELLDSYDVNVLYQPNPEQEPKEYWLNIIDGTKIVDVKKFLVGKVEVPVWVTDEEQICFATMGRSINQLYLSVVNADGQGTAGRVLEDGYQINRDMPLILTIRQEWADAEGSDDDDDDDEP